ncbi:lectin [Streptomyces griseofuscus]|uniref:lectin n=1 Tax=Streptomyces griseofuscus TaxID=146922 RepID=UPI00340F25BA
MKEIMESSVNYAAPWEEEEGEPDEVLEEPMSMRETTPSKVEVEILQKELHKVGLTCEQTSEKTLQRYIDEIRGQLPTGGTAEVFCIAERVPAASVAPAAAASFIHEVSSYSLEGDTIDSELISGHDGLDSFLGFILKDNPGGQEFVSQIAGVNYGDRDFGQQFAENNPEGVHFLATLAEQNIVPTASGTWVVDDQAGRRTTSDLTELVVAKRWEALNQKKPKSDRATCKKGEQPDKRWGQTGYRKESYTLEGTSADAIKKKYRQLGTNISAAIVEGISKEGIEATLTNQISPLQEESFKSNDYDTRKDGVDREILVCLVRNPSRKTNQGVGILSVTWRLQIKNYKSKKSATRHDASLDFTMRSILYPTVYSSGPEKNMTTVYDQTQDDKKLCPITS